MKIIILAGGGGTRLYPMSTEEKPKQFMSLGDSQPLLVSAIKRFTPMAAHKDIVVVTGMKYREACLAVTREYGLQDVSIVCEPLRKNTAPAIALAVKYCKQELLCDENEIFFIAPSDHFIHDEDAFRKCVAKAKDAAQNGNVVLLGVQAVEPNTQYGYIKAQKDSEDYYNVQSFKEKPDVATATTYLEEGGYFWNAGMFCFTLKTFETLLHDYAKELFSLYDEGLNDFIEYYDKAEKISFDCALIEKSQNNIMIALESDWSDIGNFRTFYKAVKKVSGAQKAVEIMKKNIAVLVISCDNYEDCWQPFFALFKKFWSDCPFPIYLGTNEKDATEIMRGGDVSVLKIGEDCAWADNVKRMMSKIEQPYVITFLDDFFIRKQVKEENINQAIDDFFTWDLSCLRLLHNPKGSKKLSSSVLEILPKDEYCLSTQIALWDKEVYCDYLIEGYSAWEFEIKNSRRINEEGKLIGKFASVKKPIFAWKNGVVQRKWVRSTKKFLHKNGIEVSSDRATMTKKQALKEWARGKLRRLMPKGLRNKVKNVLLKTKLKDEFVDKTPK